MSSVSPANESNSCHGKECITAHTRFDWSDQFGYSSERSFTESGTLTRTNSPNFLGPESAVEANPDPHKLEEANQDSHKNSRFNLVKQLFSSRRDSLLSEIETAEGDHSKGSSIGETGSNRPRASSESIQVPKYQQRILSRKSHDLDIENCAAIISEGNDSPQRQQQAPAPHEKQVQPNNSPPVYETCSESCDASLRGISAFRSWPLELRGRAAEWRLRPSVRCSYRSRPSAPVPLRPSSSLRSLQPR